MAPQDRTRRYVRRRGRNNTITAPATTSNTHLDCGCWRHLDGRHNPGEDIYCYFHKRIAHITVAATEYVIDCLGCSFRRRHGQNKIGAECQAARHALTRKHQVMIFYGAKKVAQFGNQTNQLTLDAAEPPPF